MLRLLRASRIDRPTSSGRTRPFFGAGVIDGEPEEIEIIGKLSAGCDRGAGALACEAIGAMLAADLGLPVPEPFLLEIDPALAVVVTEPRLQAVLHRSVRPTFASRKLPPGFMSWPINRPIPVDLRQTAVEIFAFDALIQNPDRRISNANLLFDGRNVAIFDHELAFATGMLFGWRPPWKLGALQSMLNAADGDRHVFLDGLRGHEPDLTRLIQAWTALTDFRVQEYRTALPPQWGDSGRAVDDALNLIVGVRDNIMLCVDEITRILA